MTDDLKHDMFADTDNNQIKIARSWLYKSWIYLLCALIGIFASGAIIYSLESSFADQRQVNNAIDSLDNDVKAVLINTIKHRNAGYVIDDSGARVPGSQIECNCQLTFTFMYYTIVLNGNDWTVTNNNTGEVVTGTVEQIYSEKDII